MFKMILLVSFLVISLSHQASQANSCQQIFKESPVEMLSVKRSDLAEANPVALANIHNAIKEAPAGSTIKVFATDLQFNGFSALLLSQLVLKTSKSQKVNVEVYLSGNYSLIMVRLFLNRSSIKVFTHDESSLSPGSFNFVVVKNDSKSSFTKPLEIGYKELIDRSAPLTDNDFIMITRFAYSYVQQAHVNEFGTRASNLDYIEMLNKISANRRL